MVMMMVMVVVVVVMMMMMIDGRDIDDGNLLSRLDHWMRSRVYLLKHAFTIATRTAHR